jgi:predicted metalloprotease
VTALSLVMVTILGACSSTSSSTTTSTSRPPTTTTTPDQGVDGPDIDKLPPVPGPSATPSNPNLSTATAQATFLQGVFSDIQAMWKSDFADGGVSYTPAKLVIFKSNVSTACGAESSDTGPFYCPGDRTVYLDTSFFTAMAARYGLKGDFAEAYVVAHEMGHHIQNLAGISSRVANLQSANPSSKNSLSVLLELQADCLAGVWAHSTYTRNLLEPGDIEDALNAAEVVGDDFLAHASGSAVDPDSWTHGSSAQRQQWFTTGFDSGSADACNTFNNGS